MLLLKKDVPKWLRNTNFYQNLGDDDEEFEILDSDFLLNPNEINILDDLFRYIKSSNFWGYDLKNNISQSAIDFIKNNKDEVLGLLYSNLNLPEAKVLLEDINSINYSVKVDNAIDYVKITIFNNNFLLYTLKLKAGMINNIFEIKEYFNYIKKNIKRHKIFSRLIHIDDSEGNYLRQLMISLKNNILRFDIGEGCEYIKVTKKMTGGYTGDFSRATNIDKNYAYQGINIPLNVYNIDQILEEFNKF